MAAALVRTSPSLATPADSIKFKSRHRNQQHYRTFKDPKFRFNLATFFFYITHISLKFTRSVDILLFSGSLKFISKHPGEDEVVIWMRSGTQGNKWRFVDLTFNSDKPIQVFLLLFIVYILLLIIR